MDINDTTKDRWAQLLETVLTAPGTLSKCFNAANSYSLGNQLLAFVQCDAMGIEYGPLGTFDCWKRQGRYVTKGSKALALWQPMTIAVKDDDGEKTGEKRVLFSLARKWFTFAQTAPAKGHEDDVQPVADETIWDLSLALEHLDIKLVPFGTMPVSPNTQGYAYKRNIAINPAGKELLATQFHELGHVVLGHTTKDEVISDDLSKLPTCVKELEAESVAMLCMDALGYESFAVNARGYIQHWMKSSKLTRVPEDSARRIFSAADKILKAGRISLEAACETVREDELIAAA